MDIALDDTLHNHIWMLLAALLRCPACPGMFRRPIALIEGDGTNGLPNDEVLVLHCPACEGLWVWPRHGNPTGMPTSAPAGLAWVTNSFPPA